MENIYTGNELKYSKKILFAIQILIVFLPLHTSITFFSYLLWDNFIFVKTIAAWKEIIIFFLLWNLFKEIKFKNQIYILLGFIVFNLILFINAANSETTLRFNRSYGLFYIFFFLGSNFKLLDVERIKLTNAFKLALLIIVIGGLLDFLFHFGNFLSTHGFMNYSTTYLRVDEGEFNSITQLPHTYFTGDHYRIGSFVLHPLAMNIVLLMYVPYIIFSYLCHKKKSDLLLIFFALFCIFISFSRSPLIILTIIIVVVYFIQLQKNRIEYKYYFIGGIILLMLISTSTFNNYVDLFSSTIDLTDPSAIARTASYLMTWDSFTQSITTVFFGSPQFNYYSESEVLSLFAIAGCVGFFLVIAKQYFRLRYLIIISFEKNTSSCFLFASLVSGLGYLSFALINPMFTNLIVASIGSFLLGETRVLKQRSCLFQKS